MDGVERSVGHEAVACGQRPPEEREHVNEDRGCLRCGLNPACCCFQPLGAAGNIFPFLR